MRWKGLIFLVVLVAVCSILSLFFMDRWIESGIEKTASAIVGARVEIEGLHISLVNLSIKLDRMQITDPDKTKTNLIETGRITFSMNPGALLRRRTVIREMTIVEVRTGTTRETDGAIPKSIKKESSEPKKPGVLDKARANLTEEVNKLPVMNFDMDRIRKNLNLDSLIVLADLTLPRKLDSAQTQIQATGATWDAFFSTFHPDEDLEQIRDTFSQIDAAKIRTVPELVTTLDQAKKSRNTLLSIQDTIRTRKKRLQTDFAEVRNYASSVDDWYKEDYRSVLAKAKLPDLSVTEIGKMVFGPLLVQRVQQAIGMVQKIRSLMPKKSDQQKKEKPKRLKGQTIHFRNKHAWPAFLIEQTNLSGQTGYGPDDVGLSVSGQAKGFTSQPWIYGQPTSFNLNGSATDGRSLRFEGLLDHVAEKSVDTFDFRLASMNLNNVSIGKTAYLPDRITRGKADLTAHAVFEKNRFEIEIDMTAHGLDFDFQNFQSGNQFVNIVQTVIGKLDRVTLHSRILGEGDNLTFNLDSNLDDRVSKELRSMGSKALRDAQNQVRGRLETIRNDKMGEVNQFYEKQRSEMETRIKDYEKKADEYRMLAETKIEEIEKDIEKRKKAEEGKLKKKAEETLKGLF